MLHNSCAKKEGREQNGRWSSGVHLSYIPILRWEILLSFNIVFTSALLLFLCLYLQFFILWNSKFSVQIQSQSNSTPLSFLKFDYIYLRKKKKIAQTLLFFLCSLATNPNPVGVETSKSNISIIHGTFCCYSGRTSLHDMTWSSNYEIKFVWALGLWGCGWWH